MRDIANLAKAWMERCGFPLSFRHRLAALDVAVGSRESTEGERTLLAAACDLIDMLSATPEGRQALRDLGFDPLLQNPKGE